MLRAVEDRKNLAAAGNYAAEDVLSESASVGTPWLFEDLPRDGYIVKAQVLIETTALTPRLTLYLYNDIPSCNKVDNVGNDGPKHADITKYLGKIDFPAMEDLGGDSESISTSSTYGNLPITFELPDRVRRLYGILVTRDAITGEAAGMECIVKLTVEYDQEE